MVSRVTLAFLLMLWTLGCWSSYPKPGVVRGADLVQKSPFFESAEIGEVQSITIAPPASGVDYNVIVAGTTAAAFVTRSGELRRLVRFESKRSTPVPIDVEGDGTLEFMDRGGGWQPVALINADGRTAWQYEGELKGLEAPNEMDAGDLDGDGRLEFVIGMNGAGGVLCRDDRGATRWTAAGMNVFSVAVLDANADGRLEVVHSNIPRIEVRDAAGALLKTMQPGFGSFATVAWPDARGARRLMGEANGQLQIVDFEGKVLARFDATGLWGQSPATVVRLAPDRPYFAVGSTIKATMQLSRLKIFEPGMAPLYEEVFGSAHLPVAALGDDTTGRERLLVGSGSQVWSLQLR